jgi:hypothetical protein
MAQERIYIDISEEPDLRDLVDQVRSRGASIVLRLADEDVAVLEPPKRSRKRHSGVVTEDDPLFRLIGIGGSGAPGPRSEDKYEALLQAKREHCRDRERAMTSWE